MATSVEMAVDDALDGRAVAAHQERHGEETGAPGDDRQQDEPAEMIACEPRGDRDQLVGQRGQPFEQDDPMAVFRIGAPERFGAFREAVEFHQPEAEGIIEQIADEIPENPAHDRCDRADQRVGPGPIRAGQDHRHQHHVRRNRKKRTFGEGHQSKRIRGGRPSGERQGPVVETSQHGVPRAGVPRSGLTAPKPFEHNRSLLARGMATHPFKSD